MDTNILRAALDWAEYGCRVFPCRPRGKRPAKIVPHGVNDASTDLDQIREWFIGTDYNLGVRLGSRLLLIDVDCKPGGVNGHDAFSVLCERELIPLDAFTQSTPSRGLHVVATIPEGEKLPKQSGVIAMGVEYKTGNQYFVSAPSVYVGKDYSGAYLQVGTGDPDVEIPRNLFERIRGPERSPRKPLPVPRRHPRSPLPTAYGRAAFDALLSEIENAPAGERHRTLFRNSARVAELILDGHLGRSGTGDALINAGLAAYHGEVTRGEIDRTVADGLRQAMNQYRAPRRTSA